MDSNTDNSNITITIIDNIQTIDGSNKTIPKSKPYVLRAAKNYRLKHPEKLKEYREKYKKEKQETDISQLSNDKLTKNQLIIKLQKTEENIKTLEIKVKELEKLLNKE